MDKKIIRAGIVGSGFAARFHYDALQRVFSTKVEIAGVYSVAEAELEEYTRLRKLKAYHNLDELIANCDLIHVCTPPVTHEPIVIAALKQNKHVIVEKPFTGYFGDGSADFNGDTFSRELGLEHTLASIKRMLDAEQESEGRIMYAENWVYAPAIQKEREILEKTGAQIIWMHGEQSHSGSHSLAYGQWKYSGGGSMIGKGCHPLTAAIYLKHVEGRVRNGAPIRPVTVSSRTHAITRMPGFKDEGHLQTTFKDIEDFAMLHIVFEDGTIADLFASELVLGGVNNKLEVNTSNHRTICNIGPNDAMQAYTPNEEKFKDIYVVEKTETKQGWSSISPDEGWFNGYQHEMDAFYRSAAFGDPIESNSSLAADVMATIYAGYVSAERKGTEVTITNL
ncbi:Gfo/Idh/MocA family protein [Pedobacter heparinus]|uniref:Oxidoreductase domain protein n=1 Tax=Pedobacter heparinus (strain ATCC 13125 / DSM 2366 / CIP 104194 / JCM 7457 / NBRC 12017 / NCIMB 9290 / NRRL B-14731 / HIM 762-3) TaxID=485917 RepID=C6Y330_PEDHD|nr:Gfo/Idh/MocA family oxidoreductase [Pedobacter heparinus]ACU03243.1 oxidoreductase domain protein [Pedobacter heparinus DSM 2366]